jgi:hypothetical protein
MDDKRIKAVATANGGLIIVASPIVALVMMLVGVGSDEPWLERIVLPIGTGFVGFATGTIMYWWGSRR